MAQVIITSRKLLAWAKTFLLISSPLAATAGGYQVNLMGVKQIGMGHTGTALAQDAATVYFNPGGMVFLNSKYSFSGGVSAVISHTGFASGTANYTAYTNSPASTPFNAYGSLKVKERWAVGLGVYTPYGSTVKWEDNWKGQYLIKEISLKSFYFQPTVSFKVCDKLGIGAGLVYALGYVKLSKALPVNYADGHAGSTTLEGNTNNFGYNLGVYAKPTEKLHIGLTYHSRVDMNLSGGSANFDVPPSLASNFPNTTFSASIPLASLTSLGLTYKATEKLDVALDVNYTGWDAYKSLDFTFEKNTSSLQNSQNPRNYKNAWAVRIGGQYKLAEKLTVRTGAYYDLTPVDLSNYSPETPDANKLGLSAGFSYRPTERFGIDGAFLFIDGQSTVGNYAPGNFKGTYKTLAYIPALAVSYNF